MRRPPARSAPILVLLAGAGLGAGCSAESPEATARDAARARTAERAPSGPVTELRGRRPAPAPGLASVVAARDAGRAGWESEVLALAVERRLDQLLAALLAAPEEAEAVVAAAAVPGFAGLPRLVPGRLARVFDDGALVVLHDAGTPPAEARERVPAAAARPAEPLPLGSWARLEDGLVARLAAAAERRVDRWVTSVAEEPGGWALDVRLRFVLGGHAAAGAAPVTQLPVTQITVDCATRWREGERGPELVALERTGYEEVRAPAATFEELTAHALAGNDFWASELLLGNDAYQGRRDRTSGLSFLGMHGCAVGDVDGDGLEDLYLCQPGGEPNRLLVQRPDGRFTASADAGVDFLDNSRGALLCDLDNDGDLDLVVARGPHVLLAFNDGGGRFEGVEPLRGEGPAEIYGLCAADADGDGLLDLYACRYVEDGIAGGVPTPYHDARNGAPNLFWLNEGERRFRLATDEVGLGAGNTRFSLAALWEDFDGDGDPDLYVVNDFGKNNLFQNDSGRFTDVAEAWGATDMAAGMGVTCADVDLDGDLDLYVSNMFTPAGARIGAQRRFGEGRDAAPYLRHARGNTLLLADGVERYADATLAARAAPGGWAWGAMFLDLDNDGLEDLYVPNGFVTGERAEDLDGFFWREVVRRSPPAPVEGAPPAEYREAWEAIRHLSQEEGFSWNGRERNYAYLNLGGGRFADVSAAVGGDYLDDARVACVFDWDGDGGLDLWLRNRTAPRLRLLRNAHGARGHFLEVRLTGTRSNRDAVGARVRVELADGRTLQRGVRCGEGYLGQSSRRLHFGLGAAERVARLVVTWPDGATESFADLAADARYHLVQGEGVARPLAPRDRTALASATPERLPAGGGGARASRVVPATRLPMATLALPRYGERPRRLEELAGAPVLVVVWGPGHAEGEGLLAALAAERAVLEQVRTQLALVALDEAGGDAGRALVAKLGLGAQAGRADRELRLALEVLLVEVLGPFESLPLPLALLCDGAGQLVALHAAPAELEPLLRDAAKTRFLDPEDPATTKLTGGRWIARGGRDLSGLASVFRRFGVPDAAAYYERLAGSR